MALRFKCVSALAEEPSHSHDRCWRPEQLVFPALHRQTANLLLKIAFCAGKHSSVLLWDTMAPTLRRSYLALLSLNLQTLCHSSVLPRRRQYATASCSGRTTGHFFTHNYECVPPNNFMGQHWVKAFCSELGGNVTFEQYAGSECTGEMLLTETFPFGCSLCTDPGYTCYGGGLRSVSISCISAAGSSRASTVPYSRFFLILFTGGLLGSSCL